MRIPCPICGARSYEEYTYQGDATVVRPNPETTDPAPWHAYVYLRDDPKGPHRELWHHTAGCRAWIVVERDTVTHAVHSSTLARSEGGRQA